VIDDNYSARYKTEAIRDRSNHECQRTDE